MTSLSISRVQVIFWSATVVAVVLLGVVWTLAYRVGAQRFGHLNPQTQETSLH